MPFPPTPRLCAHCGLDLGERGVDLGERGLDLGEPEGTVTVEDLRTGEQRHLHDRCFETAFRPTGPATDAPAEPKSGEVRRRTA